VLEDGLQVLLLADVARRDDLAEGRADGTVLEEVDERRARLLAQNADRGLEVGLLRDVAALDELREVREEAGGEGRAVGVAGDGDFPPARGDLDAECVFEKPQVFVVDTEERAEPGLGKGERNGVGSDVSARLRGNDSKISAKGEETYFAFFLTNSTISSPWTFFTRCSSVSDALATILWWTPTTVLPLLSTIFQS